MKTKRTNFKIAAAAVWVACIGFIGAGMVLSGGSNKLAFEKAQRDLRESREKLAFAQSAGKDETKQTTRQRLVQTQESLKTFACPAAAESALIFSIGQLADTLQLKRFTSRVPDNMMERTLDNNDRIDEGWLTVDFVADYLKTVAFINSLERHEPVLFVESFTIRRSEENSEEASVRLSLSYLIRKLDNTMTAAQANAGK